MDVSRAISSLLRLRASPTSRCTAEVTRSALRSLSTPSSFLKIRASIDYLQRNELDAGPFEHAYWARIVYPLNALVLSLVVMPFAFGALRAGGFGKRLFIGIAVGLGFFFLQRLAQNAAEVYGIDPRLSNVLPSLLLAVSGWLYFRRAG